MALKLRKRTLFPATIQVTSPLTLTKNGSIYQFGVDPSQGAVGPTGPGYGGTSETSLEIATGAKFFVTQSGYAYQPGNYIRASSAADGTNYMEGTITSYDDTSLIMNVTKTGGSGTFADWAFSLAGAPGANGIGSGDMLAAQNLNDVSNKKASKDNISVHGADVASASTIDLEAATGDLVDVTGTTAITAITLNEGHERTVRFTGILTLTNGASLVLPGAANITTAVGDFAVFRGYGAGVVRCVSYQRASGAPTDQTYSRGYISGLTLSNDAVTPNTILDIAAGVATSDDQTVMMKLASAYTKTTGAWAVGTGNGALDTGSVASSTWYHVFQIMRPDTGVVDILFSTSATAPTMPTNYTKKRRIGSFKTDGSSNILGFVQLGFDFIWKAIGTTYTLNNPGTSAVLVALNVPLGVSVRAKATFFLQNTNSTRVGAFVTSTFQTDVAANVGSNASIVTGVNSASGAVQQEFDRWTNTSQQIRYRLDVSNTSTDVFINTFGWFDPL